MTNKELIEILIKSLSLPKTQGWVGIPELIKAAEKLDGDKKRSDN